VEPRCLNAFGAANDALLTHRELVRTVADSRTSSDDLEASRERVERSSRNVEQVAAALAA
jgi:hypothetical protein